MVLFRKKKILQGEERKKASKQAGRHQGLCVRHKEDKEPKKWAISQELKKLFQKGESCCDLILTA